MQNPFSQGNEMDQMCGGFKLSRTERFYAFGCCFLSGFVLSFLSTFSLGTGNIGMFATLYSIGNIVSLLATGFLIGFMKQFSKMFDPTRRTAAVVFWGLLILTFVSAFSLKITIITLVVCIGQYVALLWYSLSYIPFARDGVKAMVGFK
ncbi:Got1/Sft2-like family-domain-containing protein [Globomyces pollinis-pini]|nr:Got1/Sft2-like family-domain-containing protein [Globomyces pollinis-pini]